MSQATLCSITNRHYVICTLSSFNHSWKLSRTRSSPSYVLGNWMPSPEHCWRPQLLSAVPGDRMKPWLTPSHSEVVVLALSTGLGQEKDCGGPNLYRNQDPAATTRGEVKRSSSSRWKWASQAPAGVLTLTFQRHLLPWHHSTSFGTQ